MHIFLTVRQVVAIADDGFLSLMDDAGRMRYDLKIPEDESLASQLHDSDTAIADGALYITVLALLGRERIIACRVDGKAAAH